MARFALFILGCLMLAPGLARDAHAQSPAEARPTQAADDRAATEALARRYAPIVYIRAPENNCSKQGETFFPSPVEIVLSQPGVALRETAPDGGANEVVAAPRAADLGGKGPDLFLDLPGDPRSPRCTYEENFRKIASNPAIRPTAYAHIAREEGHQGFALQYWLFYYFNDWNNRHEGDWEMIQLTFDTNSAADALQQEPSSVAYSQHGGGETADWHDEKLRKEDGRPVSYAAQGAHANQFEPKIFLGLGEDGTGFGCDRANPPHSRFDLESRLIPEDPPTSGTFGWITFEGRWGQSVAWEFNGPTGPNMKQAWNEPFTWQDRLRDSSTEVPGGDLFGANAIDGFCSVVTVSGAVLGVYKRWPLLIGGAGGLLLIGGAFLGTSVLRDARREPAMRPPYTLRRKRTLGQILRAAAMVYRNESLMFIGIALVMIPLSVVASAIGQFLFRPPSLESVTVVLDRFALVALAINAVQATLSIVFVITVTIAAVGQIERREWPSVGSAYGEVFTRLSALIRSRVRALAIIVLLSLTVVGIPWAINRAIRWYFVEEAVLIDGFDGEDALRRSSDAVRGNWWRAAGLTALITGMLALSAPLLAAVLLLLTPVPLPWINAIGAAVYAALLPFAGIALALIYFDLQERHAVKTAGQARAEVATAAHGSNGHRPEQPVASPASAPDQASP